jgi:hypothetical protein
MDYKINVRLSNRSVRPVTINAMNVVDARMLAESQYGKGNVLSVQEVLQPTERLTPTPTPTPTPTVAPRNHEHDSHHDEYDSSYKYTHTHTHTPPVSYATQDDHPSMGDMSVLDTLRVFGAMFVMVISMMVWDQVGTMAAVILVSVMLLLLGVVELINTIVTEIHTSLSKYKVSKLS